MKRNLLKRIGAVALAVAVSLTMGTAAFASESLENGVSGHFDPNSGSPSVKENAVTITKQIVIYNTAGSKVYKPNISYKYAISSANGGATVNDGKNPAATVKAGEMGAVTTTSPVTVSFTAVTQTVDAAVAGTPAEQTFDIAFNPTSFSSAGIFRYKITESEGTDGARAAAGVTKGDNYKDDRFLDVYVMNDPTAGKKIYGYVLFEGAADTNLTTDSVKSNGWVQTTSGSASDVDNYYTTNLTVSKTITGTLADTTHNFPFYVSLTNTAITSQPKFLVDGTEITLADTGVYTNGTDAKSSAFKLGASKGTFEVVGIPNGFTAVAKEYNDTGDTYSATITNEDSTDIKKADVAPDGSVSTGDVTLSTTKAAQLNFTNNLDTISPTNVVMRFAPYLFILGAAIVLLVLMRRRKAHNDAE